MESRSFPVMIREYMGAIDLGVELEEEKEDRMV
jgi:hypothetical protein